MCDIARSAGEVRETPAVTEEEMEKINRYTRRRFGPEEVYVFSLVLCDNEVDREYERFSLEALKKLRALFPGKTCIFDHERKSVNQTARIFETALEQEDRLTAAGEPYTRLVGRAYLPRTAKTEEIVTLIEGGILKEVSVSCAVAHRRCSVCGQEHCAHEPGKRYGGALCVRVLEDPTDAYECSFVAVPAQPAAGVRKAFREDAWVRLEKRLHAAGEAGAALSAGELSAVLTRLETLQAQAAFGERQREALLEKTLSLGALAVPEAPRAVLHNALGTLSGEDLEALYRAYAHAAEKSLPLRLQLAPEAPEDVPNREENAAFLI